MRLGTPAIVVIAWALAFAWVSSSLGGVADSPLPSLGGPTTQFLFTVPGVMKVGNLDTEFTCTSLSRASFKFAVQLFASTGGDPVNDVTTGNGAATLAPGATQTIATGSTAGVHEDVIMTFTGTPLRNGSARIVSESRAIACTAYVVDKFGTKRCGGASTSATAGLVCTSDTSPCDGGAGSCRTTPDSMLELKLISKTKQRGE